MLGTECCIKKYSDAPGLALNFIFVIFVIFKFAIFMLIISDRISCNE